MSKKIGLGKISISKVTNGEDAYTVNLSRESFIIALNSSNKVKAATSITVDISAYKGSAQITDFTIGSISSSNNITPTVNNANKTVTFEISSGVTMNVKSGMFDIPVTINETGNVITKVFHWTTTNDGTTARTYFLTPSTLVVKKGADNTLSPNSITFNAYYRDGNSETQKAYVGHIKVEESIDGSEYTTVYDSGTSNSVSTYSLTPSINTTTVKCTLMTAGTNDILDTQSVSILTDVDNINLSVRNLVLNSHFELEMLNWEVQGLNTEIKTDETYGKYLSITSSVNGDDLHNIYQSHAELHEADKQYTISFLAKASVDTSLKAGDADNPTTFNLTTTWQKCVQTYTTTSASSLMFYPVNADVIIDITMISVVEGNVDPDWSPSPEDANHKINEVKVSLEQTAEGFSQQVISLTDGQTAILQDQNTIQTTVASSQKAIENFENITIPALEDANKENTDLINQTIDRVDGTTQTIAQINDDLTATKTQIDTNIDGLRIKFAEIGMDEEKKAEENIINVTWISKDGVRVSNRDPSDTTSKIEGKTTLINAESFAGYVNDGTVTGDGTKVFELTEERVYTKSLECEKGINIGTVNITPCSFNGVGGFTITRAK